MIAPTNLDEMFGSIDIYLFDQLLRGRLPRGINILDAGCGSGRNIRYLMDAGHEVFAVDEDADAVSGVMRMAGELNPSLPASNFRREAVELISFPAASMDACSEHRGASLRAAPTRSFRGHAWKRCGACSNPGGLFFCRLASNIGMEITHGQAGVGGVSFCPTGPSGTSSTKNYLLEWTAPTRRKAWLDPLKTTIVQDQRCMTTWVLRKAA
jgi:tellurite methyltransferase